METFPDLFLCVYFLLFNTFKVKQCVCSVKSDSVAPWTVARQALLSMELFGQESWSGLPLPAPEDLPDAGVEPASLVSPALVLLFPFPRDLPNPGIESSSPALTGGFFTTEPSGKPTLKMNKMINDV